jgi:hypothetical protein
VRAALATGSPPALAAVELGDEAEPATRRRVDVRGQLRDLPPEAFDDGNVGVILTIMRTHVRSLWGGSDGSWDGPTPNRGPVPDERWDLRLSCVSEPRHTVRRATMRPTTRPTAPAAHELGVIWDAPLPALAREHRRIGYPLAARATAGTMVAALAIGTAGPVAGVASAGEKPVINLPAGPGGSTAEEGAAPGQATPEDAPDDDGLTPPPPTAEPEPPEMAPGEGETPPPAEPAPAAPAAPQAPSAQAEPAAPPVAEPPAPDQAVPAQQAPAPPEPAPPTPAPPPAEPAPPTPTPAPAEPAPPTPAPPASLPVSTDPPTPVAAEPQQPATTPDEAGDDDAGGRDGARDDRGRNEGAREDGGRQDGGRDNRGRGEDARHDVDAPEPSEAPSAPVVAADEIPAATDESPAAPDETTATARHARPSGDQHRVRPGESLWTIAEALAGPGASDLRVSRLMFALWDLNADRIGTGDADRLPVGVVLELPRS